MHTPSWYKRQPKLATPRSPLVTHRHCRFAREEIDALVDLLRLEEALLLQAPTKTLYRVFRSPSVWVMPTREFSGYTFST
jgi:hypothetical protein